MTDSSKHFKVLNMHAVFPGLITICSLLPLFYSGCLLMDPTPKSVITGIVVLVLTVIVVLYIYFRCKAVIDYDGKMVRVRALFRKYDIDLEKVKRIEYSLHSGLYRYSNYCIKMEFFFSDGNEAGSDSEVIFDTTRRIDLNKLIQGDHSDLPIMQMYDDIVSRYPEMDARKAEDPNRLIGD